MSIGSLVRVSVLPKAVSADTTQDSISGGFAFPEERMLDQALEQKFGPKLFYKSYPQYLAEAQHPSSARQRSLSGTMLADWDVIEAQLSKVVSNIWGTQKLRALLSQPLGSPIDLTIEEADEIVRLAAGRRPDLPPSKEFVEQARELLGHSLIERVKKSE